LPFQSISPARDAQLDRDTGIGRGRCQIVLDAGEVGLGLLERGAQVLVVERPGADAPDDDGAHVEGRLVHRSLVPDDGAHQARNRVRGVGADLGVGLATRAIERAVVERRDGRAGGR